MARSKIHLGWKQVVECVELHQRDLREKDTYIEPKAIYGVVRGGIIPAALLHRFWPEAQFFAFHPNDGEPQLDIGPNVWIVDDVYDTGATLDKLHLQFPNASFHTLWAKHPKTPLWVNYTFWSDPFSWLVFPWELEESLGPAGSRRSRVSNPSELIP